MYFSVCIFILFVFAFAFVFSSNLYLYFNPICICICIEVEVAAPKRTEALREVKYVCEKSAGFTNEQIMSSFYQFWL